MNSGLGHSFVIEGFVDTRSALRGKRRARAAVQDDVSVGARLSRIAGVEVKWHRTCPNDADVARKLRIGSHDPPAHGPGGLRIEVSDLPASVDTGICAARADDVNGLSRHALQCTLYEALNGA